MDSGALRGGWQSVKDKVTKQWNKLTAEDVAKINGSYDELMARLQKAYGYRKEQARTEIENFIRKHGLQDDDDP